MAQEMTKLRTVLGLPVAVDFRTTPCKWTQSPKEGVWVRKAGKRVNPLRFQESTAGILAEKRLDAWQVREAFLSVKSEQECLEFLNNTGSFSLKVGKGSWSYRDFRRWQAIFREFLKCPPSMWNKWLAKLPIRRDLMITTLRLHADFKVRFWWQGKQHYALIIVPDTLSAILASIYIDHQRGAEFRFCARLDCRKPYEIQSKHKRKYCSQYCAHLESLRRMRARQKKAANRLALSNPSA